MNQVSLGHGPTNWALVDSGRVTGESRIAPRLRFEMNARTPRERQQVELHLMQAELRVAGELLGSGFITGVSLPHGGRPIAVEIPVSRVGISFLEIQSPEDRIDLEFKLTGWLRGQDNSADAHRFTSDPQPGEPIYVSFGQANRAELRFEVARSDWFSRVLEPIGTVHYISTEIVLPRDDTTLQAAVSQIQSSTAALGELVRQAAKGPTVPPPAAGARQARS